MLMLVLSQLATVNRLILSGRYLVHATGEIESVISGKMRKLTPDKDGYLEVCLAPAPGIKQTFKVHSLVKGTFDGPRPEGMTVSHLNGDHTDNRLENLVYETQAENIARKREHGTWQEGSAIGNSTITEEIAKRIKDLYGPYIPGQHWTSRKRQGLLTMKEVAAMVGASHVVAQNVINGRGWTHV